MRPAPKSLDLNVSYRRELLSLADGSQDIKATLRYRCARDITYWIDTFCWTYDPKNHSRRPYRPFILYDYQQETAEKMLVAIGRHDLLAEKSRQMGFTWVLLAVFLWYWLFKPGVSFLLGSRKEDLVDKSGDPISLFWKLDFMLSHLPPWMRPAFTRTDMHLHNEDNDSTIDGESTNDDFARGGTRTAIGLDEFSAVENGYSILRSVGDATDCCIYFGTSQGASGAYYDLLQKMKVDTPERVINWHWSQHPIKRLGLYTTEGNLENGCLKILDTGYEFPADYPFILDGRLRSVAYDERERRAPNKQIMAQEWDIEYFASASQWFDQKMLDRLKAETVSHPAWTGDVVLNPDWRNVTFQKRSGGCLQLWFTGDDPDNPLEIPREWNDITCGCDLSMGKAGEYSSNSVASFFRRSTGWKIAEFTTNSLDPTEFCRHVLGLCHWFNDAYVAWEENGPGVLFTTTVKGESYRNVFMRDDSETKFASKKTVKPGWWSNRETKKILLTEYSNAMLDREFKNPSKLALEECGQYIQQPNGYVEHARARGTEDPSAVGENHGDRVIADALAWRAASDLKRRELEKATEPEPVPENSFGGRWERYKARQASRVYRYGSFSG